MRLTRRATTIALPTLALASQARAQIWSTLSPPSTLEEMARRVDGEFPSVRHLPPSELSARLGRESILLLDVREQVEFDVSHLERAERIDPSARAADVLGHIGPRAGGAAIVFYCSVGQRSSRMAARTQGALAGRGARAVYNLRGGIFAWHNEERALVNALGSTQFVHPYNSSWGRLLERPENAATRVS